MGDSGNDVGISLNAKFSLCFCCEIMLRSFLSLWQCNCNLGVT